MTADAAIERALDQEFALVAHALLLEVASMPVGVTVDTICRAACSVGLELGLTVAITDIAAGRQLQDWITAHVQRDDPRARAACEASAARLLRATR